MVCGTRSFKIKNMKIPIAYEGVRCPYCKQRANISQKIGWRYWLKESGWQCPHCKEYVTTEELHEQEQKDIDIKRLMQFPIFDISI